MLVHLARRGLEHPNAVAYVKRAVGMQVQGQEPDFEVPVWGFVLIYASMLIGGIGITLLSYMLNEVITTLCMIESPVAAITVTSTPFTEAGSKAEKENLLETGPAITLVNQKPITSSIRATIKHLVAHAGRFARFRAFGLYLGYNILTAFVTALFAAVLPAVPGQPVLVAALSGAALANLHATWTHKVVSMPSSDSVFKRLVSRSQWKVLAVPAAIEAAMPYVAVYLIAGVGVLLGLHRVDEEDFSAPSCSQVTGLVVRGLLMVVAVIATSLFLCVPAMVTLVRIEASVLPEERDTIVPFDRSFGGKVVSRLQGGSGRIAFLDAWRSFNWEARRRLIKLFLKSFLIVSGAWFVFMHVLAAEMFVVMGPALGKFLSRARAEGRF